jgi:hypothetical protein
MPEVIRRYEAEGLTPRELERARRELRAGLALARPGWPWPGRAGLGPAGLAGLLADRGAAECG